MRRAKFFVAVGFLLMMLGIQPASAHHLKEYRKVEGVTGNLSSMGSDTLANLMTFWAEAFERHYPNVNVQIQSAGRQLRRQH